MIKEVCVENFTDIPRKIAAGADRIELCDNLAVGGTTTSIGVMSKAKHYCEHYKIPLMCLIRPRGGNFVYTADEYDIILQDIVFAKKLGVYGIVIGALTSGANIDTSFMNACLDVAGNLNLTFHMAFDAIRIEKQLAAIDWLVAHGFSRILTHGSDVANPIENNIERIQQYIEYADNRIVIMPGGGITHHNVATLAKALQTDEFHGTKIV